MRTRRCRLCAVAGHRRAELLLVTYQDITHPDHLQTELRQMGQVLSGAIKPCSMKNRHIRKAVRPAP